MNGLPFLKMYVRSYAPREHVDAEIDRAPLVAKDLA
jgi:hypothetical protein